VFSWLHTLPFRLLYRLTPVGGGGDSGGGGRDSEPPGGGRQTEPDGFDGLDLELDFSETADTDQPPAGEGFTPLDLLLTPPDFGEVPLPNPAQPPRMDPTNTNSVKPSDMVVLEEDLTKEQIAGVIVTTVVMGTVVITFIPAGQIAAGVGLSTKAVMALKAAMAAGRFSVTGDLLDFWNGQIEGK
jgi:hypothetical protein